MMPSWNSEEVLVVERLLPHDGRYRKDDLRVGDWTVLGDASPGVLVVLAAQSHQHVRHGLTEQLVLLRASFPHGGQFRYTVPLQLIGLCAQPVGLRVEDRAHVGFGHRRDGLEDALFAAAGARAVS